MLDGGTFLLPSATAYESSRETRHVEPFELAASVDVVHMMQLGVCHVFMFFPVSPILLSFGACRRLARRR